MIWMARKKSSKVGFPAGAWAGACLGVASTILVLEFGARVFPSPAVVAVLALILDTLLLLGGVVGFTLFTRFGKPKKRRKGR